MQSCRPQDAARAKYELKTTLRTHMGADDGAFLCMGDGRDEKGLPGVFLRKNVIEVAGLTLRENLKALAPRVLPFSELVRLHADVIALSRSASIVTLKGCVFGRIS